MAWRVTEEEVREIMQGVGDDDPLAFAIEAANALTDKIVSEDSDSLLSDALKTQIELQLAGHFAETRYRQYDSQGTDGATAKYVGQYGQKFSRTSYGQNAMSLDVTGYLDELDKGVQELGVEWLGLAPSDQTDYVDRD